MDIFTLNPATVDTNLVYLALVTSLWVGVTAAYVPGTGLFEFIATVSFIGSLVAISQLNASWLAGLMIVVGIAAFMVMPFIKHQYAMLAVGGLLLQTLGGLFLFRGDQAVSLLVIVVTVALPLVYHQLVLMPMLKQVANQPVANKDELIIGLIGRVTKDLDPIGTVLVDSESWTATSETPLKTGDTVVVVERNGLQLIVEKVKQKLHENDLAETPS